MAIEPIGPVTQQSAVFDVLRDTGQPSPDPSRPRGITVDPGQFQDFPNQATQSTKLTYRYRPPTSQDDATAEQSSAEQQGVLNFNPSRLLQVQTAPQQSVDTLTDPRQQVGNSLANFVSNAPFISAGDAVQSPLLAEVPPDQARRIREEIASPLPAAQGSAVFEFASTDFRPDNAREAAEANTVENLANRLQFAVDPSNFDNVVITTGITDRDVAQVLDQPRSANDLETPVDDLDNPARQSTVEPFSPSEFAEFRVFEERAVPDPVEGRDDDSDFGERLTNNEVIEQSATFAAEQRAQTDPNVADVSAQAERARTRASSEGVSPLDEALAAPVNGALDTPTASAPTRTVFERPSAPVDGLTSNPQAVSSESSTTGFREPSPVEVQRPRVIRALLGSPQNIVETFRVYNELPVEADDLFGLDEFDRVDLLGSSIDINGPLGRSMRLEGETAASVEQLTPSAGDPAGKTTPGVPEAPPLIREKSEEVQELDRRQFEERITFTFNEIASAQDFVNTATPNIGTNFYFFA